MTQHGIEDLPETANTGDVLSTWTVSVEVEKPCRKNFIGLTPNNRQIVVKIADLMKSCG